MCDVLDWGGGGGLSERGRVPGTFCAFYWYAWNVHSQRIHNLKVKGM